MVVGVGTIIAGALDKTNIMIIICGVLQLVISFGFIGLIWSWVWAYFIYTKKQACK